MSAIDSRSGHGTTVRLYLPRHDGEPAAASSAAFDAVSHPPTGETILVVEDEAVVRGVVVEFLNEHGYRTLEADCARSGLERLRQHPIDLLVTDVGLPGMNGRQFADQARESRPELKVLFMTGYAESAAVANGILPAGMELITKPFDLDDLVQRVRELLADSFPAAS